MAPGKAKLPCPYGSCEFVTVESEVADVMRMLEMHEIELEMVTSL